MPSCTAKITVKVWDFGPLGTAITPLKRGRFPQRKCILKVICTEIMFMKYKEEFQVITTVNEFLRFHTNPSNQHYANYHEIRSHMRRFIVRIYGLLKESCFRFLTLKNTFLSQGFEKKSHGDSTDHLYWCSRCNFPF